ncbi:phage tail assembly protein [Pseudomonas sp. 21LCFQ010]|uniref:phage tail assembly protein n=1 Tax=Pseudomonas sp. 21LCFQ010 TaxID=2957506 RepID=UPI0020971FD6|nr:phage tail assembly protein [Pseudomonas sp. 21LCFQ010]MCO8161981.1 phage tail assembly protein [Pseudomonas sp. 21LCFQ010]
MTQAKTKTSEIITLDTPIQRGETTIKKVTIRKPMSGELRGASLIELMNMDVVALRKVLPRITDPILHELDVSRMDPADLVQCGVAVTSFLLTKSAKAQASQGA